MKNYKLLYNIAMNDICRLCLSIAGGTMHKLYQDSEIYRKITSCFVFKISLNNNLPSHICASCLTKINETYEFHTKVLENEKKLQQYLHNENISTETLYEIINNGIKIKEEPKNEIIDTKKSLQEIINNSITDERNFSSDEELTLSSLKKEKDSLIEQSKINKIKKFEDTKVILEGNTTEVFTCLTCFIVFKTQNELIKHYSSEHSQKKTEEEYIVETLNGIITYKCCKCDKAYEKKKLIERHAVTHQRDRPFICKSCGRTYKTVSEIVRHGRVHNGFKLLCPQNCGYSTVYRGALKEHIKRHSKNPDYKYTCDKCGKCFNVKTWHDQHQNIHSGLKPYVCNICGLAFHMDRYLTSHRSTVHPQTSSVKRYVCTQCQLPCDSRKALTLHMEVHGIKASFLCDTCGKVLSSAEQLKHHKSVHLGVKPYSCSICTKSFTKKFNLKIHARTHSGERDHACAHCERRYTQRSTLLRHYRRSHAGSQKCSNCDKTFPTSKQMLTHQKTCL